MKNIFSNILRVAANAYNRAYNAVKVDDETARRIGERYLEGLVGESYRDHSK